MAEADVIARTPEPRTVKTLAADLRALGLRPGSTLVVHSSLSAIGWTAGGAQAVVMALLDALGPDGTLVMPTHSGEWSDPAHWQRPPVPESWWETIRTERPAFDPRLTPTRAMGAIAECFRSWPGSVRSNHATASFAALGPDAERVTADHAADHDGLGERSPLGRLYELDADLLLLGVGTTATRPSISRRSAAASPSSTRTASPRSPKASTASGAGSWAPPSRG